MRYWTLPYTLMLTGCISMGPVVPDRGNCPVPEAINFKIEHIDYLDAYIDLAEKHCAKENRCLKSIENIPTKTAWPKIFVKCGRYKNETI